MQIRRFLISLVLVGGVAVFAFMLAGPSPAPGPDGNGEKASFTLKSLDGQSVSVADYRGKVVLVNFWATWCPPCVKEIPDLVKLRNKYKDDGFEILGLVLEETTKEPKVRKMVENFKISYPVLWSSNALAQQYKISSIPRTLIIDKSGNVVEDITGMRNYAAFEGLITKYMKASS